MNIQPLLDWIYLPRRRALELGFNYEGTHFGIPVWCEFDEDSEGMGMVATKFGPFELALSLAVFIFHIFNSFRDFDDQSDFPFLIKPIDAEAQP